MEARQPQAPRLPMILEEANQGVNHCGGELRSPATSSRIVLDARFYAKRSQWQDANPAVGGVVQSL